jgi:hypothetical protein
MNLAAGFSLGKFNGPELSQILSGSNNVPAIVNSEFDRTFSPGTIGSMRESESNAA